MYRNRVRARGLGGCVGRARERRVRRGELRGRGERARVFLFGRNEGVEKHPGGGVGARPNQPAPLAGHHDNPAALPATEVGGAAEDAVSERGAPTHARPATVAPHASLHSPFLPLASHHHQLTRSTRPAPGPGEGASSSSPPQAGGRRPWQRGRCHPGRQTRPARPPRAG